MNSISIPKTCGKCGSSRCLASGRDRYGDYTHCLLCGWYGKTYWEASESEVRLPGYKASEKVYEQQYGAGRKVWNKKAWLKRRKIKDVNSRG